MIQVCDAIMGSGKSSAAINYMNEHSNQKFIYITPYLDEADRIKEKCLDLHFIEPNNKLQEYNFRKCEHTAALINQGKNIATTHQAFKLYTQEMLDDIKNKEYCLIIDESLDVLERFDVAKDDIQMALEAGYINLENGRYTLLRHDYCGQFYKGLFNQLETRELICLEESNYATLFYWKLPLDLICSFKSVFILTYLFEGQALYYFFKMYNLPYEYIGVSKHTDGKYYFSEDVNCIPEYVKDLHNKIQILDSDKLNNVGNKRSALSMNWFKTNPDSVDRLGKNIYNCMNNIWRDTPSKKKLWGTYESARNKITGRGYTKQFLIFNSRATNNYRSRDHLIYAANPFMNVTEKCFYTENGICVDEDMYALSILVQWIWRSAIRDGNEIWVYVPSARMRELLIEWVSDLCED